MTHLENRSALAQRAEKLLSSLAELVPTPRPYQIEEWQALVAWLKEPNGTKRGYVSQATGLGKTYLFASLLRFCAGLRALIVVPTKALLQQTAEKIVASTGGLIGHISSIPRVIDRNDEVIAIRGHEHSDIVITTEASFKLYTETLAKDFVPSLILWDECHRAYTSDLQNGLGQFPEAVIIGFSATPDYLGSAAKNGYVPVEMENGLTLYGDPDRFARTHFQTMLAERTVRWGIESGWLAPFAWGRIEFDASLEGVPLSEGEFGLDYNASSLQNLMAKHWSVMCETIRRLYANSHYELLRRQSFAICPGVEQAQQLAETINGLGIAAACITGDNPDAERTAILKAYDHRDIQFISSVMVLREGWDAPSAEVGLMLRVTKSRVAYIQGMGRLLRIDPNGAHKVALVLDAHFQSGKFAPLSAPIIFGKDKVVADGILCGPKREGPEIESPYLPKNAEPRLVIIYALETEWDYRAGTGGFFEAKGYTWGTIKPLAREIGLSDCAVSARVGVLESMKGRDIKGKPRTFYRLDQVREACADLIKVKHKAGKDGFFEADGHMWGTVPRIAKEIDISGESIRDRIINLKSMQGGINKGGLWPFYRLDQVREACADLIKVKHKAGKDGSFEADGFVWGTPESLAKKIGISRRTVRSKIKNLETKEGRDRVGHPRPFYRLDQVREACVDLIKVKHKAGKDGFFEADGHIWGTRRALANKTGLSFEFIQSRVSKFKPMIGKNRMGKRLPFYRLDQLQKACAKLLKKRKEQANA